MEHIIKNYDELGTTELRKDALNILEAGYFAIKTKNVIRSVVKKNGDSLEIKDAVFDLKSYNRIFFVGVGKCAAEAAEAVEEILHDNLFDGIAIDVREGALKKIRSCVGTHPYPSEQNVVVAREIVAMLSGLTEKDLVLNVISGGGSALLSLPHAMTAETLTLITKTLMDKGAPIREINIVRKHLSEIQGGFLAQMAFPAQVISLVFSDVPGNDLSTIASGPTVFDKSTKEEAEAILLKYDIANACGLTEIQVIETPKDKKYFENVKNFLVVSNEVALCAMLDMAENLKYKPQIKDKRIEGEARILGANIVSENLAPGECHIYGGETTVMVSEHGGAGGRNQELVLGALSQIKENMVVVAAASDGWDNSDCAGAIGDTELLRVAEEMSLKPEDFLTSNNSFEFFSRAGGHLKTGRTGANVADLYFVLTK